MTTWWSTFSVSLDYLIATVSGVDPIELVMYLETKLELRVQEVRPLSGYHGYSDAVAFSEAGERLLTVQWTADRAPLVIVPGQFSARVEEVLKRRYAYQCSRKDAAVDFFDEGAFDAITACAIRMANVQGVRTSLEGDWATPGAPCGRTLYIYRKAGETLIRIYEHSKLHEGNVECRVEVVRKPGKKAGKEQLAELSPHEVVGESHFAVDLLAKFGVEVPRIPLAQYVRQRTDLQQRLVRLWMQYGRTLDEVLQNCEGDLEGMLRALLEARGLLAEQRQRIADAAARPKAVPVISL